LNSLIRLELFLAKVKLPILVIPTLPATSSEMNCGAVVTNDETVEKSYVFNEVLFPKVAMVEDVARINFNASNTLNSRPPVGREGVKAVYEGAM
jgi:alcohol dehydrogenase YqhD (iron-dependent ADH family)